VKLLYTVAALFLLTFSLFAEPVSVGNTGVTYEPPEGFRALSESEIALKWPSGDAPKYAVGIPSGSTTVAYDLKPHHVPQVELELAKDHFTKIFESMVPGLVWKKNEIVEHSGQKWILLELTSSAVDTDIYNIMMITGFQGKMLLFNFNSTKEDFPKYEAALRKSLESIKLP